MKNSWVIIIVGLVITILIVAVVFLIMFFSPLPEQKAPYSLAVVTIIPGQTTTPIQRPTIFLTPTPTVVVVETTESGIQVNGYAQITGTEGEGLRLRSGPGRSYQVNFIGMDNEVFQVVDGPVEADGYTWWKLQAPYDQSRNGWSVEAFLEVVNDIE